MRGDVQFGGKKASVVSQFAAGSELLGRLSEGGDWFIVADFEGRLRGWQFADVQPATPTNPSTSVTEAAPAPTPAANPTTTTSPHTRTDNSWHGPLSTSWASSHSEHEYRAAVSATRDYIREGDVYQANICRVLSSPMPEPGSAAALAARFEVGNPAPFLGHIQVESPIDHENVWLTSASPELFFKIEPTPQGAVITSSPIKGTASTPAGLTPKDEAENVMITDLVRNDISPLCVPGSVAVRDFLAVEQHPGLVHLVSTVVGDISAETLKSPDLWHDVFGALFPPGSVSGAPKSSALRIISELEHHHRGPYCGGFGWVNGDTGAAELAVGIRSFWWEKDCAECGGPTLHFGTGAGITWGSDPGREWEETQLKASRLIALASSEELA